MVKTLQIKKIRVPKTITFNPDLWDKLGRISENTGISRSLIIDAALQTLFEDESLKDEGISLKQESLK